MGCLAVALMGWSMWPRDSADGGYSSDDAKGVPPAPFVQNQRPDDAVRSALANLRLAFFDGAQECGGSPATIRWFQGASEEPFREVVAEFDAVELPAGSEVRVESRCDGFSHATATLSVTQNESKSDTTLRHYRRAQISIRIRADALDSQVSPTERDALGFIQCQLRTQNGHLLESSVPDGDGICEFEVTCGVRYLIEIGRVHGIRQRLHLTHPHSSHPSIYDVQLRPSPVIRGRVTLEGKPVPGAAVEVYQLGKRSVDSLGEAAAYLVTDDRGEFEAWIDGRIARAIGVPSEVRIDGESSPDEPVTTVECVIAGANCRDNVVRIPVVSGTLEPVEISMAPARCPIEIHTELEGERTADVSTVTYSITSSSPFRPQFRLVLTSDLRAPAVCRLEPGHYLVEAKGPGLAPRIMNLRVLDVESVQSLRMNMVVSQGVVVFVEAEEPSDLSAPFSVLLTRVPYDPQLALSGLGALISTYEPPAGHRMLRKKLKFASVPHGEYEVAFVSGRYSLTEHCRRVAVGTHPVEVTFRVKPVTSFQWLEVSGLRQDRVSPVETSPADTRTADLTILMTAEYPLDTLAAVRHRVNNAVFPEKLASGEVLSGGVMSCRNGQFVELPSRTRCSVVYPDWRIGVLIPSVDADALVPLDFVPSSHRVSGAILPPGRSSEGLFVRCSPTSSKERGANVRYGRWTPIVDGKFELLDVPRGKYVLMLVRARAPADLAYSVPTVLGQEFVEVDASDVHANITTSE